MFDTKEMLFTPSHEDLLAMAADYEYQNQEWQDDEAEYEDYHFCDNGE